MAKAGIAFAAFCCAASSAYILNDVFDLEADRRHPDQAPSPVRLGHAAAGRRRWRSSRRCSPVAVAISWASLPRTFAALLALYVVLTSAYSLYLKRIAVVDVLLLAGLYTLRVLAGIAAAQVRFSTWLLAFAMFLFLSLAFLKRYTEVSAMDGAATEQVRGGATSAGTASGSARWAAPAATCRCWCWRSTSTASRWWSSTGCRSRSGSSAPSSCSGPAGCGSWRTAGKIHDDPIVATVRDPASYLIGLLVALVMYLAL